MPPDQRLQPRRIAPDAKRVLGHQRQGDVGAAGPLNQAHHAAAGAGDQRGALGLGNGLGDLDRAALHSTRDHRGQHLQHNRVVAGQG